MRMRFTWVCFCFALLSGPVLAADTDVEAEPLSKADFLAQQRTLFNTADKDFDGSVSQDEIGLLNDELNKPKHVTAFKDMDADNNGYLSLREIEARHQDFTASNIEKLEQSRERLLKRYDTDGDGNITARELDVQDENKRVFYEAATQKNAAADLKAKDADASGSVSLDEYLSTKTTASLEKARQSRIKGELVKRDGNGDRSITRPENEAYLELVFSRLDKNEDDQLSASEQSNHVFRSSQRISLRTSYLSYDLSGRYR